jgi:hypothetical protein
LVLSRISIRSLWLGIFAIGVLPCIIWPAAKVFNQPCDEEDNVAARLAVFRSHMGTDPTDEYTTGSADNEALAHSSPPFWVAEDGAAPAPVSGEQPGTAPMNLSVTTPRESVLVLNLREFPAWLIRVNGRIATKRIERADGLIAIPLKAGRSDVAISYTITWDRELGDGITLLALCVATAMALRRRTAPEPRL